MWNGTDPVTDGKTEGVEDRKQRGMQIAALARIDREGDTYIVPSVTNPVPTRYKVTMDGLFPKCTCPDFEIRGCRCKHIYAVEFYIQREQTVTANPDGSTTVTDKVTITRTRKTYSQDWPNYNAAQQNEKREFQTLLAELCNGIEGEAADDEKRGRGRPRVPLRDVVFAVVFKVYSTVSGRRFTSDLCDAQAKGHISRVPHYNTCFKYIERADLYPVLAALVERSALPLKAVEENFAIDSTGFCYSRFDRWFDIKHNRFTSKQGWVKAHIMCGVKTNVVTAVEIKEQSAGDIPQVKALVQTTAQNFTIREASMDKGYSSREAHDEVAKVGGVPFIAFKANTTGGVGGLYAKMWHFFNYRRDEFLAHYHQRSNVESTVMMIKAKFGDALRSKTEVAGKNEVLAKVLCHNIACLISAIYELGLEPEFPAIAA